MEKNDMRFRVVRWSSILGASVGNYGEYATHAEARTAADERELCDCWMTPQPRYSVQPVARIGYEDES